MYLRQYLLNIEPQYLGPCVCPSATGINRTAKPSELRRTLSSKTTAKSAAIKRNPNLGLVADSMLLRNQNQALSIGANPPGGKGRTTLCRETEVNIFSFVMNTVWSRPT